MGLNDLILRDLPIEITTKRLILRVPRGGDGPQLHEAMLDGYEDLVKWVGWNPQPPTVEEVEIESRKHFGQWWTREDMRFVIIEKQSQQIIGRCAYPSFQSNFSVPLFGISYFIRQAARNQGFGTEMLRAMINFAFGLMGARKIQVIVDTTNLASISMCEKLKLIPEVDQVGNWFPYPDETLPTMRTYVSFKKI